MSRRIFSHFPIDFKYTCVILVNKKETLNKKLRVADQFLYDRDINEGDMSQK